MTKAENFADEPLYPEILSACRTVWKEATPILYSKQTFSFRSDEAYDFVGHLELESVRACRALMSYNVDDWDVAVPYPISNSTFAAFLRKIGPYNASLIHSVKLYSTDRNQAAEDVLLATELCAAHLPSLETFTLHVEPKEIRWDESPEYFHPDYSSPFWANGPFQPMYTALQGFAHRIRWLKALEYDYEFGQSEFEDRKAFRKLLELQDFVKRRRENT